MPDSFSSSFVDFKWGASARANVIIGCETSPLTASCAALRFGSTIDAAAAAVFFVGTPVCRVTSNGGARRCINGVTSGAILLGFASTDAANTIRRELPPPGITSRPKAMINAMWTASDTSAARTSFREIGLPCGSTGIANGITSCAGSDDGGKWDIR